MGIVPQSFCGVKLSLGLARNAVKDTRGQSVYPVFTVNRIEIKFADSEQSRHFLNFLLNSFCVVLKGVSSKTGLWKHSSWKPKGF